MYDLTDGKLEKDFERFTEKTHSSQGQGKWLGEYTLRTDKRLLKKPIHRYSLEAQRELPIYLTDLLVSSKVSTAIVTPDHISYWAWTSSVSAAVTGKMGPMTGREYDRSAFNSFDVILPNLKEMYCLAYLVLLPLFQAQLNDDARKLVGKMNTSVKALARYPVLSLIGTNGLSVLEGLVSRHCDKVGKDGNLKGIDKYETDYNEEGIISNHVGIGEKLHLWREQAEDESPKIFQTLETIDDLSRETYDIDVLKDRLVGFPHEKWNSTSKDNTELGRFFWILHNHRHTNIHGLSSTEIVGPLAMNLCCLVFWDRFPDEYYSIGMEGAMKRGHNRISQFPSLPIGGSTPLSGFPSLPENHEAGPEEFYPVFSWEKEDMDKLLRKHH